MDPDDQAEAERRVKAMRRKKAREFGERVETWLRPPKRLDSDLANDLARLMGKDLYAVYANQLSIEAVEREPEAENMKFQAVQTRENNGKMLLRVVISAQFGSKWEGEVIVKNDCTAKQFLAQVEEESTHKVKSYTVSFNGRLLRHENVLYDIGIRDGQKLVLLPMGSVPNFRPHWSLRQSKEVVFKMEERHKKLKLSDSTVNLMKDTLGKKLFNTIDTSFNIVDKFAIDPDETAKQRAARELKEKRIKDAEFERTDIYGACFDERPKAQYKHRTLRPLAGFTTDAAKFARASRPLQNYEEAMAESTQKALMGKPDPTVPRLDSLKQWHAAYGNADSFFKAGADPALDQTAKLDGGKTIAGRDSKNECEFIDKNPLGVMSRFEQSRRSYGKERSQVVMYKKGNLAA